VDEGSGGKQVHGDEVHGDKIGRDKYVTGDGPLTVHNTERSSPDLAAAVRELRDLIARLQAADVVTADGETVDPQALETAVRGELQEHPDRVRELRDAVASGATEAVKASVQEKVGAWILMLIAAIGG
jgi:hypothetical protein